MKSVTKFLPNSIRQIYALIAAMGLTFLRTTADAQTTSIVWSENWERTNWINDWHVDAGTWEVGNPTSGPNKAYNSPNCAATVLAGNYPEPTNTRLIRHTSFVVPPVSENPRLRFWHWFSFGGDDYGEVQIKVGNNAWKTIGGPYVNTGSGVWTCPSIDLSQYAGATIQIAFFLHSQPYWNGANTASSGWYIDDLALIKGPIKFSLSENWEAGLGDWYPDKGTWQVGKPTTGPQAAYSGQNCAATVLEGNYWEPLDTRLVSPRFVVPPVSRQPRLRFWHWFSFGGDDYGEVHIKVGNDNWKAIAGSYVNTSSGVWTYPSIDLSAYADSTVQIAFYLHSQPYWNGANTASSGWYIDDVALITNPIQFNAFENWETGLGDWHADKGTWQVGKPTTGPQVAYSGQNCAATVLEGNYWEPLDTRLISPRFVVPAASRQPRLRFWHWFSFGGDDYGEVHIKVGNGNWKAIAGSYVNTGSGVWTYPSIDLSAYADSTAQIAFYLHSQPYWNGANTASSGWYIDDVALITTPIKFNSFETWEVGLGDWHADKGTWQVGKPTSGPNSAYSGQNCVATVLAGNYWEPVDTRLISPAFVVPPAASNPALQFWHWFSFGGDDAGYVQIKIGKEEWKTVFGPIVNASGGIWTPAYIPLSDYAGKQAQIAFYLHSQPYWNGANTSSSGWYIDDITFRELTTDIDEKSLTTNLIESYILHQNYPNPFNPSTVIEFALPQQSHVILKIFTLTGQEVATLVDQNLSAGRHKANWDASGLRAGIYFYQLKAEGEFSQTKKLTLLK